MAKFGRKALSPKAVAQRFQVPAGDETTRPSPDQRPKTTSIDGLTVKDVEEELKGVGLYLDRNLIAQAVAALRSGKHLMLSGPPGTGKTTFGKALATVAHSAGICTGLLPVTATADWTSSDTVGAYRLTPSNELEFRAGQVLQSIDEQSWILIDELNRADIDKAIGQIFTVLSGQAVVLPFLEQRNDLLLPPSIVPANATVPTGSHPHYVSENWRVIATLNDRDRDLLFDMSEALMRRFAVIEVGPPSKPRWIELLKQHASTPTPQLDKALLALSQLKERPLGPAIIIDCGRYIAMRSRIATECGHQIGARDLLQEAIDCFVAPHLKDSVGSEKERLDAYLQKLLDDLLSPDQRTSDSDDRTSSDTNDDKLE